MALERAAHLGAGAVQQHALVAVAHTRHATRLFRVQPQYVAEHEQLALPRGQRGNGRLQDGVRLPGLQLLVRVGPAGRRSRPPTRALTPAALEALGWDRRLALLTAIAQRGERQHPPLARSA